MKRLPNTSNENAFSCIKRITNKLNLCKTPEHEKREILQMLYAFEHYLRNEFADKLRRRNMQIKELKKKNEKYLEILKKNGYIGD